MGTGYVSTHVCFPIHIHDKRWAAPSQNTLNTSIVQASIKKKKNYSNIQQQ